VIESGEFPRSAAAPCRRALGAAGLRALGPSRRPIRRPAVPTTMFENTSHPQVPGPQTTLPVDSIRAETLSVWPLSVTRTKVRSPGTPGADAADAAVLPLPQPSPSHELGLLGRRFTWHGSKVTELAIPTCPCIELDRAGSAVPLVCRRDSQGLTGSGNLAQSGSGHDALKVR